MNKLTKLLLLLGGFAIIAACNDDDEPTSKGDYEKGLFICNQGPFQTGTGSISYLNLETNTIENEIFQKVNNRPIGNIVQSLAFHNEKGYIMVNNAEKVEVVNANTFESLATIEGFAQPRYFIGVSSEKGYVSQWGADGVTGSIKVLDLNSNTISKTIATNSGPEKMLLDNGKVYVTCTGGFSRDSVVQVIDISTDEIVDKLYASDAPNSLVKLGNELIVLSSGYFDWIEPSNSTVGSITNYNLITGTRKNNILDGRGASHLVTYDNELYFNSSYARGIIKSNTNCDNKQLIIDHGLLYGMYINPTTGLAYGADAKDLISNGLLYSYNISTGVLLDSFEVGIIPSEILVK